MAAHGADRVVTGWRSTRGGPVVPFVRTLFEGLAPDGGLYVPASPPSFDLPRLLSAGSFRDVAVLAARALLGDEVAGDVLEEAVDEAFDFPVPLVDLGDGFHVLELFHGPTLAFKDVGARFMAALMDRLDPDPARSRVVLVATSGDTGSAVARAFAGRGRFRVVVLYPRGGVSDVQRRLFTTLGGNVTAAAVRGTFDDCQRLVKGAFADPGARRLGLTAANSINPGRLVPQAFYYVEAVRRGGWGDGCVLSVPSGNLGNLTAGVLAADAGLPVRGLVAAQNANDALGRYLRSGERAAAPSRPTVSNAMDVGDPSNLERLVAMVPGGAEGLGARVLVRSFDDATTLECIARVRRDRGYLLDPHGAVGMLGAEAWRNTGDPAPVVVLATAHPAKFPDVVRRAVGEEPAAPDRLARAMEGREKTVELEAEPGALRDLLEGVTAP